MNCAKFHDQLSALLDGEATESAPAILKEHMHVCEDCARAYERMAELDERLKRISLPVPRAALAWKVKERLPGREQSQWGRERFSAWRRIPALVAILALAIGLGNMAGKSMTELLLDRSADTQAELFMPDSNNSLADAVLDIGSEENRR